MFRKRKPHTKQRQTEFNKLVLETVQKVLILERKTPEQIAAETFEDVQTEEGKEGDPYTKKGKHNPYNDSSGGKPTGDPDKEAEWDWMDQYLSWAEASGKREDVTRNNAKMIKKGFVEAPDFSSPNEAEFESTYDYAASIAKRRKGSGGSARKGEAYVKSKFPNGLKTPEDVVNLFDPIDAADAIDVQAYLLNGKGDNDGNADVVAVEAATPVCENMKATQTFIDAGQSIAYPLAVADTYIEYITSVGPHDTNGRISVSDELILDGHHRWSGMYSVNPKCMISAIDFQFTNATGNDADAAQQKLANMQKAVGTMVKPGDALPSKGGPVEMNILDKDANKIEDMVRKMVETNANPDNVGPMCDDNWCSKVLADTGCISKIIDMTKAVTDYGDKAPTAAAALEENPDAATLKEAVIFLTSANLNQLVSNSGSPIGNSPSDLARTLMPQLDHSTVGGGQGLNSIRRNLAQGNVNVAESIDLQRWGKLAGLLKD